jgi:FkbM family methyltransferase
LACCEEAQVLTLTTKTKIAGARAVYRTLRLLGLAAQPGERVRVQRSGIQWELDLGEGIDFAIFLLGAFERSTLNALKELVKAGDTVLDIGANIGAHTLHLANAVGPEGRVFAFEPTDFAFGKLTRNLAINPDLQQRVIASQLFLVDKLGTERQAEIYSSWPLEQAGDQHPKHLGKLQSTSNASTETLDQFAARNHFSRVDLIKIDVDGHELPVLKGGRELLRNFGPTLVMELSPYIHSEEGNSFEELIDILRDCGYSLKDLKSGQPVKLDAAHLTRVVPDGAGINVVASVR